MTATGRLKISWDTRLHARDFVHIRCYSVCSEETLCTATGRNSQSAIVIMMDTVVNWMINSQTKTGLTGGVFVYASDPRSGVSEATPLSGVCGNRYTGRHQEQQLQ